MTTHTPPGAMAALRALHREAHRLILTTWGTTSPERLIDVGAGDPVLAVARALADAWTVIGREDKIQYIAANPDPRD